MRTSDQFVSSRGVGGPNRAAGRTRRYRGQRSRLCVESLESRRLLTTITEYAVPLIGGTNSAPSGITIEPNGTIWFIESGGNEIGSLTTSSPDPQPYAGSLPSGSLPSGITVGPGGNKIFFTELAADEIGMINPSDPTHSITQFGTADGMTPNSGPVGITSADGYLWFTQNQTHQIGRLNPTTGTITEYPAPAAITDLNSRIVLGPDGNLWFTELGAIGIFDPNTGTVVKQVTLPGGSTEEPLGIAVGPDGNIWYTEGVLNASFNAYVSFGVGVINTTSEALIKEIPVTSAAEPFGITAGPDGNIWFAVAGNSAAGTINEITPQSDPSLDTIDQTLSIPTTVVATPDPTEITAGPDGNLWFTDGAGAIGEVNLNAQPHYVVTTAPPAAVTAGSNFNFTVTAEYGSNIVDSLWNGNATVSVALIPGASPGALGGINTTVPAVQGVAAFSGLSFTTAGPLHYLQVSSSGTGAPASGLVGPIDVTPAAATKLVVTSQPQISVQVGAAILFTVAAEDPFNNVATTYSGTVTVTLSTNAGGAGTMLGGTTMLTISPASATPGLATFNNLTLDTVGTGYKLGVSSNPSLTPTTTAAFAVTAYVPPPPPPPTILSESVAYNPPKLNKKHKPVGKPTLAGYTITFDTAMDQVRARQRRELHHRDRENQEREGQGG